MFGLYGQDRGLDLPRAAADAARVTVLLRCSASEAPQVSRGSVRRRAERMLAALALEHAELSILLCDDATIRALNHKHRRRDRPTDVLAFAPAEARVPLSAAPGLLGDVVISLATAARQARRARKNTLGEVTFLLAHGLLHLLGCDHVTKAEERRMQARTDLLVAAAIGKGSGRHVDSRGIKRRRAP